MKHLSRAGRRAAVVVALGAAASLALAACAGGSGASSSSSSDSIDAALQKGGEITYWSWTPQADAQVKAFEAAYPNVKVNLVNAGTGNDEYTKLQNAITAGSGAPDVVQIEYYALPQFELSNALLDLSQYGFGDLQQDYTASTWGHVVSGDSIYGLPQDSGPIALFYNKTVFDKYGIPVPTTWDQYIAAAQKLHAADPTKYIAADTGDAGFTTTMIWQAGGQPFKTDGTNVTINLQDAGTKKWTSTWNQLLQGGLLAPIPAWSDDWYKALGNGTIASIVLGAWMPGVLQGSVPQASGDWAVAPVPTYDGKPATSESGGGAQAVTKQSQNPALAAGFLKWLNNSDASLKIFTDQGGFPSTKAQLTSPDFLNYQSTYFGGQKINQVLSQAAQDVVPGWQYLPYQVYANSIFGDTVGQSYANKSDLNQGLTSWQASLVQYGNSQGFSVNK
ncbi:sugar ABC transporter substrate-binding protein [Microbacterium sp. X-17]|uniref:ABC transporter substrate-binding protein n=1 Tax=Microbacterium sp. X-17 TaxID=3144404 RepID=UPI0031F541DF